MVLWLLRKQWKKNLITKSPFFTMQALMLTLTMVFCFLSPSFAHFNSFSPCKNLHCVKNSPNEAFSSLFKLLDKDKPNLDTEAPEQEENYQIRTVVIDPGHGGHDAGCSGAHSHEKEIVLNIAIRLGNSIQANYPHIKVIYTRDRDVFIPLHKRARIANENKADLFISIHCNSIANADYVRGSETYVLGLHRAADNLEVAKRENSSILLEDNYQNNYFGYDPNSTENHILMSLFQNAFLEQSIRFAEKVEYQIKHAAHGKSRGVKQAGFLVLRETAMPSVLIESGYLSNATDDQYLTGEYGQIQIASAIFRAFRSYKNEIETGNSSPSTPSVHQEIVQARNRQYQATASTNPPRTSRKSPKSASSLMIPSKTSSTFNEHSPALPAELPIVYKIQMASGTDLIDTNQSPWNKLAQSVEIRQEGHMYKYLSTSFPNIKEAIVYRNQLQQMGFKDAFVVAFRGAERLK